MRILVAAGFHLVIAFVALHRAQAPAPRPPLQPQPQPQLQPQPVLLSARVVRISDAPTNYFGAQVSLAAIVDGRIRLLEAGGHGCLTSLKVGDTVRVEATWRGTADAPWAPNVDGTAVVVEPAGSLCASPARPPAR